MCVLSLIKKDGTPFDVTFAMEEDIVEIASGWDTLIPWVCSTILQWNWSFYFDRQTRCNVLPEEPLRQWFYMRKPLPSGLPPLPKST